MARHAHAAPRAKLLPRTSVLAPALALRFVPHRRALSSTAIWKTFSIELKTTAALRHNPLTGHLARSPMRYLNLSFRAAKLG
jgi:hypothetical protein